MSDAPYGPGQFFWLLVVLIAIAAFGTVPLFVRELSGAGMDPAATALLRYVLTAVVMLPFIAVRSGKLIATLMGMLAGMVMGFGWIGYVVSVGATTVAASSVIYLSFPIFTVIFTWALLGEIPGPRGFLAAAMALVAVIISVTDQVFADLTLIGIVFAMSAPLAFGFALTIQIGWLGRLNLLQQLACVPLGTCLALAPVAWFNTEGQIIPQDINWVMILAFAAGTSLIPSFLYLIAAPRIGRVRTALAGGIELPVMMALGVVVFGETLGGLEFGAAALLIGATVVGALSHQPRGRPPAS
ncbi:MAG: DMT family transporter [Pseudomonadota bacterium]